MEGISKSSSEGLGQDEGSVNNGAKSQIER